jgi:hypothetical protein
MGKMTFSPSLGTTKYQSESTRPFFCRRTVTRTTCHSGDKTQDAGAGDSLLTEPEIINVRQEGEEITGTSE